MDQAKPPKNKNYWLSVGLKIFAESTGWIAFPVIGALYLGKYLDNQQHTGHLYFFGLTGLAFIVSCVGLGMTGVKYMKMIDRQEKEQKKNSNNHEPRDRANSK